MNIIFMRHGEATDNVKEIISDKEIYWSVLTDSGRKTVLESIEALPKKIDKVYVSPFPRTIETAHFVFEKYPKSDFIIEKRLHEINNGKYSGEKNNEDLDRTRQRQIAGDYFVRFGQYGENKYDIELRLCEFLLDVYKDNFNDNTVMFVSHGSITSYMKRILKIKTPHIKTGKIEEFIDVDFTPLFKHIKMLKNIKSEIINKRVEQIKSLNVNYNLKETLIKMIKKEFNNIEYSDDYFSNFIDGLNTKNLIMKKDAKFDDGVIIVCFYNNFENFAKKWMEHYISIGIKNFVLVNNNSNDSSLNILKDYSKKVNISFWDINEEYNCYKICGWKQKILEFYGAYHNFLIVDSDELFIYKDYENIKFEDFLSKNKLSFIKSLVLDVYTNKKIFGGTLEDFNFVDRGTYKTSNNVPYIERFYGGPISRVLDINSSLQKIPYISYTGKEVYANNYFYYPWNINKKAKFCSYLLHYKLLNSNNKISFYDKNISIPISDIKFNFD